MVFKKGENLGENSSSYKHGMSKEPIYRVYATMKQRCTKPNSKDYGKYGGRGITVCDRWLSSFINFKEDMYESYLEHKENNSYEKTNIRQNTTLDRIDNKGNYELSNCRWSTQSEQSNNKGKSIIQKWFVATRIEDGYKENSYGIREFSRKYSLCRVIIRNILHNKYGYVTHKGWKFEFYDEGEEI